MGKSSPRAPAAPDPATTAAAQSATNKETAYWNAMLNNVNQTTPWGSISYTQTGDGTYDPNKPPQFSSTINLSPEQQKLLDTQQRSDNALAALGEQQIGRITQAVSSPYSYAGIGNNVTDADLGAARTDAQNAIMLRLDPQFQRDEEALRTRLINQGIGQGSDAYNKEFESLNQAKNDARMQAILQAGNYAGQLQDQTLQRRNQGIQEYNAQRNAPLNEYTALTSGQQVQNPSFSGGNYQGSQPVDYANLVSQNYQNQMNQYNANVASRNNTTSGLFGLGGAALSGFLGNPAGVLSLFGR